MSTLEQLQPILAEMFSVEPEDIAPGTTFEGLLADELDFQELAWILEEEFSLPETDPQELMELETVGQLVMYVSRRQSGTEA